jgi:hypothetical protein
MPKARTRTKSKTKLPAALKTAELRDSMGPIRLPEIDPEDRERNDMRELQFLQRKLAALHYEQHERPAMLAKIAQLKAALEATMMEMEA